MQLLFVWCKSLLPNHLTTPNRVHITPWAQRWYIAVWAETCRYVAPKFWSSGDGGLEDQVLHPGQFRRPSSFPPTTAYDSPSVPITQMKSHCIVAEVCFSIKPVTLVLGLVSHQYNWCSSPSGPRPCRCRGCMNRGWWCLYFCGCDVATEETP